ncbi:penicillin acylase family protein [Microlunatus parietis]|uniref:Penicillin amidase n=1 Tax=Microlunatus parietis TaxID=682979 RepID=A0A7Y9I835_9ACTN|nr:penicillin acylase family protein [Microlunatus parietis]NYE71922.1 penicillin amidase [Microlunatus parietis]
MATELFRDDHGIPHLRADDHLALAYAQGRVTAHDRGWQIEVDRLRAEGRLAALVGPSGVAWDVFARRARLADTAQRAYDALAEPERAWVDAYSSGVRRGLGEVTATEFATLADRFGDRFEPGPWPDWAPLGILHANHVLSGSVGSVLWRAHVADALGAAAVDLFTSEDPAAGSNAWALHGSRTASGRPVLAGDPHRAIGLPGVYQQIRLACPEFDVVGLAFPGVPGIAHFGHTGSAAWGITNAAAHTADVFRERLRRSRTGFEAYGPDGWQQAEVERSVITVRGGDPVPVEAIETVRGPVITDLRQTGGQLTAASLRSPARAEADLGFAVLLPLLRSRTAADVVAAFGSWVEPANRLLAADSAGTVLSATVGRLPDRPAAERLLPLDAVTVRPAASRRLPPAVVVIDAAVDANERPDRPEIDFGVHYPARYRANRIRTLLSDLHPAAVDELEPIWSDTELGSAPPLLALLPPPDRLTETARAVRSELLVWDGRMEPDSPAAARFAAWRAALVRRLVDDPVLAPLSRPHGFGAIFDPVISAPTRIAAALPTLLTESRIGLAVETLIAGALEDAAAGPVQEWGERHTLLPLHLLREVAGLPEAAVPGADLAPALAGDGDTVRCTASTPGVSDRCSRGSVARWAWDLADRDQSRWSVPFGSSGDPVSAHFADQLDGWVTVRPTRVVTDWSRLRPDDRWDPPGRGRP